MAFEEKFKIVLIRGNGLRQVMYLSGSVNDVKKDIERYKRESKTYTMLADKGMIVFM